MINVVSIFSGGGGIDCGFKKAGFDIVFSTDFWKPACDTLEKNNVGKLVVCDDIRNIATSIKKEFNIDVDNLFIVNEEVR